MAKRPRALSSSEQATIEELRKALAENDEQQLETLLHSIDTSYNVALIKAAHKVRLDFCVGQVKEIHRCGGKLIAELPILPKDATPDDVANWKKLGYEAAEKNGFHISRGLIDRGAANIAKSSRSGKPIGWYKEGQKSGKPSAKMPIEREVEEAENLELADIGRMEFKVGKARAGKFSGKKRGAATLTAENILNDLTCSPGERAKRLWSELEKQGFELSQRQVQRYVEAWKMKRQKAT